MKLLVRCCTAVISAYLFAIYVPDLTLFLGRVERCAGWWDAECNDVFALRQNLTFLFRATVWWLWVGAWIFFEVLARRGSPRQKPRLLTHLRYGPLAVLIFAVIIGLSYDYLLIQYSRWQIVQYIHGNASPEESPSFRLHNDARNWCLNGLIGREYELYGETPASHYEHPGPLVRARALRASIYTYDWLNFPSDGPFWQVLQKARNDPDPMVREIAAEIDRDLNPFVSDQ